MSVRTAPIGRVRSLPLRVGNEWHSTDSRLYDTKRMATAFGPVHWNSLVDGVDAAAAFLGTEPRYFIPRGETLEGWSMADVVRRSRTAAWRIRAAGLQRGDRLMTLAPSGPALAAMYIACWRAGVTPVPLDPRFTNDVVRRIAAKADTHWLAVSADVDATVRKAASDGIEKVLSVEDLQAEPDETFPTDWEAQLDAWPRPTRDDLMVILFTSGTTGQPKGVMIRNRENLAMWEAFWASAPPKPKPSRLARFVPAAVTRDRLRQNRFAPKRFAPKPAPPRERRAMNLWSMSHSSGMGTFLLGMLTGAKVLVPRTNSPRVLLTQMRSFKPTFLTGPPQFLDLLWRQLVREAGGREASRSLQLRLRLAARLPYQHRHRLFRRELALTGGALEFLSTGAATLAPEVQTPWEALGLPVITVYGSTETGSVSQSNMAEHSVARVGRVSAIAKVEFAEDGEMLVSGPLVSTGYWRDPVATGAAWDEQGRYHTGDIGRLDEQGELQLLGRKKDIIVRPDGLNVYPEDIEGAMRAAGLPDTVALETTPGRIEVVVLAPESEMRERVPIAVRAANSQLTVHERVSAWKVWPEADFPRTPTSKIKRDLVREWALSSDAKAGAAADR